MLLKQHVELLFVFIVVNVEFQYLQMLPICLATPLTPLT